MTEIKAEAGNGKQEAVTIETAKVVQGMSLVFCGALEMLESLHPHVSLAPSTILDLVTGNVSGLQEAAEKRRADAVAAAEAVEAVEGGEDDATQTAKAADGVPVSMPDDPAPAVDEGKADVKAESTEAQELQESQKPTVATGAESCSGLTTDDITRIVVQKIKQNPGINEKIRAIVVAHGAERVSELPASEFEAFLTDLSQL